MSKVKDTDSKTNWGTAVTLAISVGAFVISAISLIVSSFWIDDSVRIVVRGNPVVAHEVNSDQINIAGAGQWIFMNGGNRAVAVTGGSFPCIKMLAMVEVVRRILSP